MSGIVLSKASLQRRVSGSTTLFSAHHSAAARYFRRFSLVCTLCFNVSLALISVSLSALSLPADSQYATHTYASAIRERRSWCVGRYGGVRGAVRRGECLSLDLPQGKRAFPRNTHLTGQEILTA